MTVASIIINTFQIIAENINERKSPQPLTCCIQIRLVGIGENVFLHTEAATRGVPIFCKIYRKTPVPEPLFIRDQMFSCEFCEILKNTFFT